MEQEIENNALSGSSEVEVIETPAVETATPETEPLEEPAKTEEPATEAETEEDGELKPWMKKRLARERQKADREKQRADILEMQLRSGYNPQYQQQQQQAIPQNQQQAIDPTQLTEDAVLNLVQKAEAKRQQQQAAFQYEASVRSFYDNLQHGHDKFEDFEDVTQAVAFTPFMRDAILDIKDPDTFVYSLAKNNPQRLAEIARLNPTQQIREMGALVEEHKAKTKPKLVSKAPTPPSTQPKSSAGSAAKQNPADMSATEYCEFLRQQKLKSRR